MAKPLRIVLGDNTTLEPGDIIKVRCSVAPIDQPRWLQVRAQIKEYLLQFDVVVDVVQPITTEKVKGSVKVRSVQTKSDDVVVREYGKAVKAPEATLKVGLGFLKEA